MSLSRRLLYILSSPILLPMLAATVPPEQVFPNSNRVEGKLVASTAFFQKQLSATPKINWKLMKYDLRRGFPGGILTDDREFVLILADGRLLARLSANMKKGENRVRVIGRQYDDGRSIAPRRIEYYSLGSWRVFDLPFSGSDQRGVATGDE